MPILALPPQKRKSFGFHGAKLIISLSWHGKYRQFNHPSIVKTFGWSTVRLHELADLGMHVRGSADEEDRSVFCAIYELCANKDLRALLKSSPELRKDVGFMTSIFLDVLEGLEALHSAGYIHCDIKPDNILIDENMRAKIADFGLCQEMEPGMVVQGTPSYISPEIVQDWVEGTEECQWDEKADVFSFGVTMSVCLTGSFPFDRTSSSLTLLSEMVHLI
jgi:serine/threonine protein kinase